MNILFAATSFDAFTYVVAFSQIILFSNFILTRLEKRNEMIWTFLKMSFRKEGGLKHTLYYLEIYPNFVFYNFFENKVIVL
jgi:hypothetical protein